MPKTSKSQTTIKKISTGLDLTQRRLPKHRPPTHPGEMLFEEFLKPLGVSQSAFAIQLGVSFPLLGDPKRRPCPVSSNGEAPGWATMTEVVTATSAYGPQWSHPHPAFSPDGKWVSFTSDQIGHSQVYVVEVNNPL